MVKPKKNKKIWHDTPVRNSPICPVCNRHRHGNQTIIKYIAYFGAVCSSCFKRTGEDKGWFMDKLIGRVGGVDEWILIDESSVEDRDLYINKIKTSKRFPYVKGQHIYLDEYFQKLKCESVVEHQN